MTDTQWTWLLFAMEIVGVTGMIAAGRHKWWGWTIVLAHTVPWLAYSITHDKPGFIAMWALWAGAHTTNTIRWKRQHRKDNP